MASGKAKTIEEINSISDIIKVMEALGISDKGCQNLDDLKARVKTELNQSAEKPSWAAGQVRTPRVKYILNLFRTGNVQVVDFFGLQ